MPSTTPQDIEHKIRRMTTLTVPSEQQKEVRALFRFLDRLARMRERAPPACRIVGPDGQSVPIPETVFYALERVAEYLGRGDAITVVPVGKELTTQQAADILNVSRQYLVRLVDEGRLPCTKTGKHRRILVGDVLALKEERDRTRREALDELTRLSEDFGGYSEMK